MVVFTVIMICTVFAAVQVTIHTHLIIGLLVALCGSLLAIMTAGG